MERHRSQSLQATDNEWLTFPGGELEGRRPRVLCPDCRKKADAAVASTKERGAGRSICFQCYRAELQRERKLAIARDLNTATELRFQGSLPFEPVNRPRLAVLKVERSASRSSERTGMGRFADRRRRAQIAARHVLHLAIAGLQKRDGKADCARVASAFVHAAEIQLPESWLPFVVNQS